MSPISTLTAGAAWKTQAMVRRLCTEMYRNDPDGVIGNDDCGQMSAWFILSALGFYPVDPVDAVYVFGSPLFERATIRLPGAKRLVIEAPGNRADTPYVRSVAFNGRPWTKNWISHADLMKGGRLTFTMSAEPVKSFGRALADRPPSNGRAPRVIAAALALASCATAGAGGEVAAALLKPPHRRAREPVRRHADPARPPGRRRIAPVTGRASRVAAARADG
ncbi:MAG: glycoside hydrolase family 92 protein [Sphingomonas taxi]